jgi:gluconokinase
MGVSGAGKTLVGETLARAVCWEFHDADSYHSAANIEKMTHGIPLTDDDRRPWLDSLRKMLTNAVTRGDNVILACSALKKAYRERLLPREAPSEIVRFVYLDVPRQTLERRLRQRTHHFAPPELLDSQLATLEKPSDALWIDGTKAPDEITHEIRAAFCI